MTANENCGESDKGKECRSYITYQISLSVPSPENGGPCVTMDQNEERAVGTVGTW